VIPDAIIEQVRDAADLVGIVGEHVELKRTGADFRGPCPFHGGTNRNFAVIPKKGMFYCFVCHEAGDVFTFLMKKFGMDYPTAVREVARRTGITIPERSQGSGEGPDPREPLFGALAAAHDWLARQLRENPEAETARAYLASRGVDLETAGVQGLGYAPRGGALFQAMKGLGIAEPVLLEAGLLARREDGSIVPRFRGRLLFPIHDLRGRVVGFGGRILGAGEPKYLNSPDTPVFHKGKLLYNLHAAKHGIRKAERALLVEGYFDVLRLSLAGVEEVVAPLGTGLTADQAALLARYTKQVVLLYDSDAAGLRATFRAGDELLRHGLRVSVATMPPGEDPDTLVRARGREALERVLADAVDVLERKVQILERRGLLATISGRRRALDRILPTLRAAADPVTRELYVSRAAEAVDVRVPVLEGELGKGASGGHRPGRSSERAPAAFESDFAPPAAEKDLLLLMLHDDSWKQRVLAKIEAADFRYPVYKQVFEAVAFDGVQDLEEGPARAYEHLKATGLQGREPGDVLAGAIERIEVRPLEELMEQIDRRMPFETPDQHVESLKEKRQVFDEVRRRHPRYKIARRSSAPGS
jgi:DNA primase